MHHQHVVALRQRHDFLEELQLDALRRRVRRESEDHHFRFWIAFTNCAFEFVEKVDALHQRDGANLRPGDHRAIDMDRVARVWHQHRVTVIQRRQHQVRQPFFRTDGHDGFAFWVDFYVIAILIPARDRPT
ncbi:hypothetical protein D3C71_1482020 [compost metagenome]